MDLSLFSFIDKAGPVGYCLVALSFVLWYALALRFFNLNTPFLKVSPSLALKKVDIEDSDVLGSSIYQIRILFKKSLNDFSLAVRVALAPMEEKLEAHRQTIRAVVIVAPLLGLLGTVIGMIETFQSLQDQALFSQSGGIAGGISQALITTEMGLVVAIPGLLMGRALDRKQESITIYIEQVQSLMTSGQGAR